MAFEIHSEDLDDSLGDHFTLYNFARHVVCIARQRRFKWTMDLRYETGWRDTGETIAFLTTAKAIYDWVEGQLP
jgi:hypothetical protein